MQSRRSLIFPMATDRAKIEYAKKPLRRKYTGADLTSGPIVAGKYYRISIFKSGDDFKPAGAPSNSPGDTWKANGTPAVWTNGSTLNEIKVDELKADADLVFASATETVTLTSGAFEGGTHAGQITFEKALLGEALEELIEEFDPGWTPAPTAADGSVIQLSV